MTTIIKFIIGALTILLITSCSFGINLGKVNGNGNVITEDMNISEDFDEIKASRGWEVFLEKGTENSVTVEADENLIDVAKIYVENEKLVISAEDNIGRATSKMVFVTYTDAPEEIKVSSGASIKAEQTIKNKNISLDASSGGTLKIDITAKDVETDVSSGGVIRVSGTADKVDASASSGGVAKISKLTSKNTYASASSGGVMSVYASNHLKAKASSGGTINYYGNPETVDKPKKNYSGGVIRAKK